MSDSELSHGSTHFKMNYAELLTICYCFQLLHDQTYHAQDFKLEHFTITNFHLFNMS